MIMAGRLGEWSVEDLLQIAKITQKTTSIELVGEDRSGVIYLRDGGVVDAELFGVEQPAGERFSRVVEIIVALAGIEVGSFQFGTREVPFSAERPVDINAVFAALEKDLAREKRLVDLGISGLEGLGVARHIAEPLTLKPAVWQLLADLIEPFSLTTLERRVGRRKAVAMVLTLEAIGVLSRYVELPDPRMATADAEPAERIPEPGDDGVAPMEPVEMPAIGEDPGWADKATWAQAGLSDSRQDPAPDTEAAVEVADPGGLEKKSAVSSATGAPDDRDQPVIEPESKGEIYTGEPIVEIFGLPAPPMHEVVAPSETTLVSDVLGDLRSRFRSGRGQTLEPGYED